MSGAPPFHGPPIGSVTIPGGGGGGGGDGTVTSVNASTNLDFITIGGIPITVSGTIQINAADDLDANLVVATPDGETGTVGLRALVNNDLPVVAVSKGGTGLSSAPASGQLLIGNGSGYTLATLSAGTGITVGNGAGVIEVSINSDVVTLTGVQTLTNKTLTAPTIASFTNATHSHQSAAGGGTLNAAAIAAGTLNAARLPVMEGADGAAPGEQGAVPAPAFDDDGNFLRGDATWASVMQDFTVAADSGTPEVVGDGATLTIAGGVGIVTEVESPDTVTVHIDDTVATLDDAQTLTNKTLTMPTIANFTNATHSHQSAAGGGSLDAAAIGSGELAHERGGLEADVSAYHGVPFISSGATSQIKYNVAAADFPTVNDDETEGYSVGSRWVRVDFAPLLNHEWVCVDATPGAAVWRQSSLPAIPANDRIVVSNSGIWTAAAPSFDANVITSGTLAYERGGLQSNVADYNGVPFIGGGATSELRYNMSATTDPTTGDDDGDGYAIGSRWYNLTDDTEWVCLDASTGAAVWVETTGGGTVDWASPGDIGTDTPAEGHFTDLGVRGDAVFNTDGNFVEFRVAGASGSSLLVVDTINDRVGIGTNAPDALLDVRGNVNFTNAAEQVQFNITGYGNQAAVFAAAAISGRRARGFPGSETAVQSGDRLIAINATGYDGSAFQQGAQIIGATTENWDGSSRGTEWQFRTTPNGTTSLTTQMTIGADGTVTASNISLGTNNPVTATNEGNIQNHNYTTASSGNAVHSPILQGFRARGTLSSPEAVSAGDSLFRIIGYGHYGTGTGAAGDIVFQAAENFTSTARGGRIVFLVTPTGGTARQQQLILHSDGRLEIEGTLDHDGASFGVRGVTPATMPNLGSWAGMTNAQRVEAIRDALAIQGLR